MDERLLIVAGEASGDMHAAHVVEALRQLRPGIHVDAMGGDALRATGANIVVDNRDLAVVGLFEVISHYPVIHRALKRLKAHLETSPPDLLVLVDYVEFNLKLAQHAKGLGIPVLFYVSPQVWAWRPGRVKKIGERIDMMAVIFPFETRFYEQHGIPVRYVGNPLVGKVKASTPAAEVRNRLGLDPSATVVGLQPGSRSSEIQRMLPLFLEAAEKIHTTLPDTQFVLPVAPGIDRRSITELIPRDPPIAVCDEFSAYDLMQICDAVITASGTATLETALMQTPMVIAYRVSPLSYQIFRRLIRIQDIGLVNIVAEKRIVEEFVQDAATGDNIARETLTLLQNPVAREQMLDAFEQVREKLGDLNGSREMARLVDELLDGQAPELSSPPPHS